MLRKQTYNFNQKDYLSEQAKPYQYLPTTAKTNVFGVFFTKKIHYSLFKHIFFIYIKFIFSNYNHKKTNTLF